MAERARPAGDYDYESAGAGYETRRRADPRIAASLHSLLDDARTVLNVGAGAGSYEPTDRHVLAVEPSAAMRARRAAAGAVPAIDATAERLPFDDDAVDAVMAILTVHQWADPGRGLAELRRVARGPVVVMTLDLDVDDRFWVHDYWLRRVVAERRRFGPLDDVQRQLGGATVTPVPVPVDCTDGFVEAFYARPESLLDPAVRDGQSMWNFLDPADVDHGLERLRADLADGSWDAHHGHWRTMPQWSGRLVAVRSVG